MPVATRPGDAPTDRQREILDFLRSWTREHGYPPTMTNIGDAMGFRSRNSAHGHLRALRKKGLVRWEPCKSRSVTVVDEQNDGPARLLRALVALAVPRTGQHGDTMTHVLHLDAETMAALRRAAGMEVAPPPARPPGGA